MNKIYVVGIGPGGCDQMTGIAMNALKDSDTIIGYTVYVDLVKDTFPDKEYLTTPMKKEVDRCVLAFEEAMKGKRVSMICLYNPSSKKRHDYLQKACDLMMQYKSPETVCGTVCNIGREGEEYQVMTLKELRDTQVDMFTTVFIGNSQTKEINGKMVTPRGYRNV